MSRICFFEKNRLGELELSEFGRNARQDGENRTKTEYSESRSSAKVERGKSGEQRFKNFYSDFYIRLEISESVFFLISEIHFRSFSKMCDWPQAPKNARFLPQKRVCAFLKFAKSRPPVHRTPGRVPRPRGKHTETPVSAHPLMKSRRVSGPKCPLASGRIKKLRPIRTSKSGGPRPFW